MHHAIFPETLCQLPFLNSLWLTIAETHHKQCEKTYNLLVLSQSGVGKSALAKAYKAEYPSVKINEKLIIPVIYIALTDTASPKALVEQLLYSFNITRFNRSVSLLELQDRFLFLLKAHQVELIIIDEVQECLPRAQGPAKQKIIKLITWLTDHGGVPFVLFGTPIAKNMLQFGVDTEEYKTEEQLSRRCCAPIVLPAIQPFSKSWLKAVNFFLEKCSHPHLDASYKSHQSIMNRLYLATKGKFGLLEKFMLHLPEGINLHDENANKLLSKVYIKTILISNTGLNPFCEDTFSDTDIEIKLYLMKEGKV